MPGLFKNSSGRSSMVMAQFPSAPRTDFGWYWIRYGIPRILPTNQIKLGIGVKDLGKIVVNQLLSEVQIPATKRARKAPPCR